MVSVSLFSTKLVQAKPTSMHSWAHTYSMIYEALHCWLYAGFPTKTRGNSHGASTEQLKTKQNLAVFPEPFLLIPSPRLDTTLRAIKTLLWGGGDIHHSLLNVPNTMITDDPLKIILWDGAHRKCVQIVLELQNPTTEDMDKSKAAQFSTCRSAPGQTVGDLWTVRLAGLSANWTSKSTWGGNLILLARF